MTKEDKQAVELAQSLRGQYLISRSLCCLETELANVKGAKREESDLRQVKFLIDALFPMYRGIQMAKDNSEELQKCLEYLE